MSRLLRGAALTLVSRVAALILGLASSVIIARALGPVGKGEYALIVLIPALIQFTGGLGLEAAVTYRVARRREQARAVGLTLTMAAAPLGLALIGLYALVAGLPVYRSYLDTAGVDPGLVWVLVLLLPVTLATGTLTAAILGLERYRRYNLTALATPAANLALLLVLVVGLELGVAGAVLATGGGSVVGLLAAALGFFPGSPGTADRVPGVVREALGYGWRAHVANVAWFVHYRADMFLVAYLAGPAALGYYSVAVGLAEKLYLAPSAVGTVLFPRVAAGDAEAASQVTPRACRHTLWLTIAAAAVLGAIAHPLVAALFGSEFLPAAAPLWLLLPGVVGLSVGRVLSADLNGRGRPGAVARANAALAVLNIMLNLWWIPLLGAAGAALATSVSYSAAVLVLAWLYLRISAVTPWELVRFGRRERAELANALSAITRRGRRGGVREEPRA